jgi:hypothetical protein
MPAAAAADSIPTRSEALRVPVVSEAAAMETLQAAFALPTVQQILAAAAAAQEILAAQQVTAETAVRALLSCATCFPPLQHPIFSVLMTQAQIPTTSHQLALCVSSVMHP